MTADSDVGFALATILLEGRPTPIIRIEDACYLLEGIAPELVVANRSRGLLNVFDQWDRNESILLDKARVLARDPSHRARLGLDLTPDHFLPPLLYPDKVVCMGANYYEHVRGDVGMTTFDRSTATPVVFIKSPTSCLVGAGRSVRYPSESEKFDWEIELAVVIGRRGKRVRADEAAALIAGYTIAIDLSARDWQHHPKHPFNFDCFAGKSFDDSCPLGPWIVPARFVDAKNLDLRLTVNDELKQDANTSEMIWSVEEQLEAMTSHLTLVPGDVVLTGTPAGVGMKSGQFLKVGDRISARIEGLGKLDVQIAPDQDRPLRVIHA
jgi:2-keto-4-pentenoate hydratase/2-oxohepta-3-ene-1,7-dioic acid hydratase in catechol pathway